MLSGGLNYLSGQWAFGLLSTYLGQHTFYPSYSSLSTSVFSFFHLLLSADGTADRRCFQRQWLWPLWVFSWFLCVWYLNYVMMTLCFWSLRLLRQNICGLVVKDFCCVPFCSVAFFAETARKGSVVSRANSIGSTSASSVPNTGIVCLTLVTFLLERFVLHLDCDLNVCLSNCILIIWSPWNPYT